MDIAGSGTPEAVAARSDSPLTGPIDIEGAEPGDVLEVGILDVSPRVDFGYGIVSPALGLFGTLRPESLAAFAPYTEASQLSDPNPE